MLKKDSIKSFFDERYSSPPRKIYLTKKLKYIHINEIWSTDLADKINYKISNKKGFRYIFVINEKVSKYVWTIPFKK